MRTLQGHPHASTELILSVLLVFLLNVTEVESVCSENCRYGQEFCREETSHCLYGCNDGYLGEACGQVCSIIYCKACIYNNSKEICTRCKDGHFGTDCLQQCSDTCKNRKCDRFGRCVFGCKENHHGLSCEHQRCTFADCLSCAYTQYDSYCSECVPGKYWNPYINNCTNCSDHCVGGQLACNSSNGVCNQGCESRWFGTLCDKFCPVDNCTQCREVFHGVQKVKECKICDDGFFTSHGICEKCSNTCLLDTVDGKTCDGQNGKCLAGCMVGWYGDRCNKRCNISNCRRCEEVNRNHIYCETCENGFYWSSKDSKCLHCPPNCTNGCNITNGHCIGGCKDGYYGNQCDNMCGHCSNIPCNDTNGYCLQGCEKGWYGTWCMSSCPIHCRSCIDFKNNTCGSCEPGWYGPQCEIKCSEFCKRNSYSNFLYCHKETGECSEGCRHSYHGAFCNITCHDNCFGDLCDLTGNCSYGCKRNYYGPNCNKRCSENCDNCHQGDGKCAVPCRQGFYGEYCTGVCSKTCLFQSCDEQGNCVSGCVGGFFGSTCEKVCNSNCMDGICNLVTGYCSRDCKSGYYGNQCDVECSPRCLKDCKRDLGFCRGCKDGFYGNRCEEICRYCHNDTCEQGTGVCTYGCEAGHTGHKCASRCQPGYFGLDCKMSCSNCKDNTQCDAINGTCLLGCIEGWTNYNCQRKSLRIVHYTQEPDSERSTIAISTSATVGVFLTIIVIVIGAVCHRRGRCPGACTLKKKNETSLQDGHQNYQTSVRKTSVEGSDQPISMISSSTLMGSLTIDPADLQLGTTEMKGLFYMVKIGSLQHTLSRSTVMVKLLCKATQRRVQADFLHDVEVIRNLNLHRNILSYIGLCENERFIHSVFEACVCGDLKKYLTNLKRSSSDPATNTVQLCYIELVKFVVDVLQALIFLHNNKIIHRLVGAQSVYLDNDYTAKLANFHFAVKYKDAENGTIRAKKLPQRYVAWMPPEARAEDIYSNSTDMWGIGVLLWEVVTLGSSTNLQDATELTSPTASSSDQSTPGASPNRHKTPGASPDDRLTLCASPHDHRNRGPNTAHRNPGPSTADNKNPRPNTAHRNPGPSTADHRNPGPSTADHRNPGPSTADHRNPGPSTADHRNPGPSTADHRNPGPSTADHRNPRPGRTGTAPIGYLTIPLDCDRFLSQCIEQCWNTVPENRPSFTPMVRKLSASLTRRWTGNGEVQMSVSTLV
ncbi:multiple epidermal growth factor-like domains protein 11 [Pecten maximus]|uniref:multiple epidermal growth factor-like domains protein 11 n=1 Tax=Pecten maximus TaxID=6579 RepID=UPI001457E5DE|nr:multiple epidermal growth factor-like domains protein 11 [Pecten maximus]